MLHAGSDCPDTIFIAKLIEVTPDGRTMYRYAEKGPQRLARSEIYAFEVDLSDIYHTFRAGSCIQVDITRSNFPRRARNTNSGDAVLAADGNADIRIATNSVYHAGETLSCVALPVFP